MVGDPARVTPAQMERWAKDFENWAVCDTATFVLWDRTPHAWPKVREWSERNEEFVKRAAFALLASLTVHDKQAPDERYLEGLALIEREASDGRNFVKKAVNWALRSIGKRSPALNKEAVAVARRLADAEDSASRWVGKDALRELTSPAIARRLAAREGKRRR
jgi:3-methyladenine DNA glycosylase AlkD